ncbi:pseudouridine synthase [Auricularia subglabra TFB-10046 SS5]|nr:pseudouridine synthase [Auricularia subglabra TFB-10046 SS5]
MAASAQSESAGPLRDPESEILRADTRAPAQAPGPFALVSQQSSGLKKIKPYWHPYRTMAKERWLGREMLELISSEFRDRSVEYYRYALKAGVTTINGKPAREDTIVRNGDRIENIVHRHEPPVTSTPVRILHVDEERQFIVVDKPGSIPVHATGRYFKNSLVEILKREHGIAKPYTVNRLDRLTSGLMIIATSPARARILCDEFLNKAIRKEYIARCRGCFPEEEVVCDQPMLTVDRQMGLNIVHPEGKPARTIFRRLFYDANTDSSVLQCQPITGRSHQIRVHLQYLGHPVANDPVYSDTKVWGPSLGRGGLSFSQTAQTARDGDQTNAVSLPGPFTPQIVQEMGVLAPVALSAEAMNLISGMRNTNPPATMLARGGLTPSVETDADEPRTPTAPAAETEELAAPYSSNISPATPPPPASISAAGEALGCGETPQKEQVTVAAKAAKALPRETGEDIGTASPVPLTQEAVGIISRLRNMKDEGEDWSRWRDVIFRAKSALAIKPVPDDGPEVDDGVPFVPAADVGADGRQTFYCPECYLPLRPDPVPEQLYIFLHAKKYSTAEWSFETEMPEWAREGFEWRLS